MCLIDTIQKYAIKSCMMSHISRPQLLAVLSSPWKFLMTAWKFLLQSLFWRHKLPRIALQLVKRYSARWRHTLLLLVVIAVLSLDDVVTNLSLLTSLMQPSWPGGSATYCCWRKIWLAAPFCSLWRHSSFVGLRIMRSLYQFKVVDDHQ